MSDKPLDSASLRIINEVNNTPVSLEDIIAVIQGAGELEPGDRDFTSHTLVAIRLFPGKPEKVKSIMFRLEALARFIEDEGTSGWALALPSGAVLTQKPVFAAAAIHPLIDKDNQLSFDRDSFLQKVLELADLDKVG
jgi:hypothetical protein